MRRSSFSPTVTERWTSCARTSAISARSGAQAASRSDCSLSTLELVTPGRNRTDHAVAPVIAGRAASALGGSRARQQRADREPPKRSSRISSRRSSAGRSTFRLRADYGSGTLAVPARKRATTASTIRIRASGSSAPIRAGIRSLLAVNSFPGQAQLVTRNEPDANVVLRRSGTGIKAGRAVPTLLTWRPASRWYHPPPEPQLADPNLPGPRRFPRNFHGKTRFFLQPRDLACATAASARWR